MFEITHDDYSFAERDDQEHWVIHLKTGKWKDTYYCYDRVQLVPPEGGWPEEGDGEGTLSFNYGLIESPFDLKELSEDVDFNEYIGDILRHIIEDSFDSGNYKLGNQDGETE